MLRIESNLSGCSRYELSWDEQIFAPICVASIILKIKLKFQIDNFFNK